VIADLLQILAVLDFSPLVKIRCDRIYKSQSITNPFLLIQQ